MAPRRLAGACRPLAESLGLRAGSILTVSRISMASSDLRFEVVVAAGGRVLAEATELLSWRRRRGIKAASAIPQHCQVAVHMPSVSSLCI